MNKQAYLFNDFFFLSMFSPIPTVQFFRVQYTVLGNKSSAVNINCLPEISLEWIAFQKSKINITNNMLKEILFICIIKLNIFSYKLNIIKTLFLNMFVNVGLNIGITMVITSTRV